MDIRRGMKKMTYIYPRTYFCIHAGELSPPPRLNPDKAASTIPHHPVYMPVFMIMAIIITSTMIMRTVISPVRSPTREQNSV